MAAVAALTALLAIGPPGNARAATGTGYNQITGEGSTTSAVTVNWTQGLLDSSNNPLAANADRTSATPTSPASFMYPDFKNLQVTVSQTQDLTHQGITVSWTGGQPTISSSGVPAGNFLQLMECYGDLSSGPSPQGCEFGSGGLVPEVTPYNANVGSRSGPLCAAGSPSTSDPPAGLDGSSPLVGCDPEEPVSGANPPDTNDLFPQLYDIPFVPVASPTSPAYTFSDLSQYFTQFDTNEVPEAVTSSDGTGQVHFVTLTGIEAPGLGCGQLETNGQTRNCWLVIVPRGQFEPNGFQISPATANTAFLAASPLSASNWAMRIQVHLGYAPVPNFCPIGTKEVETVGTQIVTRAVQSWQVALNQSTNCQTIYGYSAVPEATSTQQLGAWADPQTAGGTAGLAFTTIPIGSEAARDQNPATSLPPILYAPVAVSAEGFGFNISQTGGFVSTPVKLTPELVARALTQVYRSDLPDYYPDPAGPPNDNGTANQGPAWSTGNRINISQDGMFQQLNPEVSRTQWAGSLVPQAPLLTEDHSALNQQIWHWIQAETAASAWLNTGNSGNPADFSPPADPDYLALQLGTAPDNDSFPRAYAGVLDEGECLGCIPPKPVTKRSLDLLPYVNNYDQAATDVLTGNDPVEVTWNSQATAPDGSLGWWDRNPQEKAGNTFMWGISDTPDLARYGLIDAQLCDDSGASCVGPSTASLATALDSAKPDSAGLLQVNPANPGSGGYPLTQVTYAAVATNQPAADLIADANLIEYAVGNGQTSGVAPGQLPPGYLPFSAAGSVGASLKAQAMDVVKQLQADANPSPSGSTSGSSTSGGSTSGAASSGAAGGSGLSGQLTPALGQPVSPAITAPRAQLAAARTGRQPVGAVRWVLLAVVVTGAACAAGGTVLRSDGLARWLRRMRT